MHVEIRDLVDDADHLAGILRLRDGVIVAEPDSLALRNILAQPVLDWEARENYWPEENPEQFLRALHQQYTSPYLRASKVIEDDSDSGSGERVEKSWRGDAEAPGLIEKSRRIHASGQQHLFDPDKHPHAPAGPHGGQFVSTHGQDKVDAALARHASHNPTTGGGLFGDMESRRGFAKLPHGTPIVFTEGEFAGRTGKVVRDEDALTGTPRIVAEVDGREGLVPISPEAIEPLAEHLSWRVGGGGSGVGTEQGGLFSADQFLPKRGEEKSPSPLDNTSPKGDNSPGGGNEPLEVRPRRSGVQRMETKKDALAQDIQPVNDIEDYDKYQRLVAAMREDGWQGPPIPVVQAEDGEYQAWTGSHRIFAARRADIDVPVLALDQKVIAKAARKLGFSADPRESNNEEKLAILQKAGYRVAADVLRQEIEKAEAGT